MIGRLVLLLCGCVVLSSALSGCGETRRAFGLERTIPNEFDVVANAPLAIPPDYNLRPPKLGAPPTQSVATAAQAKETIFRAGDQSAPGPKANDAAMSAGEGEILRAAGASDNEANIRDVINREAAESQPFNKSFVDRLVFWRNDNKVSKKDLLDPVQESERLGTAKGGGDATVATQMSAPPTIDRKSDSNSFLDRLF